MLYDYVIMAHLHFHTSFYQFLHLSRVSDNFTAGLSPCLLLATLGTSTKEGSRTSITLLQTEMHKQLVQESNLAPQPRLATFSLATLVLPSSNVSPPLNQTLQSVLVLVSVTPRYVKQPLTTNNFSTFCSPRLTILCSAELFIILVQHRKQRLTLHFRAFFESFLSQNDPT